MLVLKELSPQEIFRAISPSIYVVIAGQDIDAIERGHVTLGSAVAISNNQALTNCHVVKNQQLVALLDGDPPDRVLRATIVRADPRSDRCFLTVDGKLAPVASVRRVADLAVGERVYTIGNPSGLTKTLGEGLISGLRQTDGIHYVQTSAPISPGSSGGALVDSRGSLVGITTFLLKEAQNLNFAIAAEEFWK
jgi:S1-C subfamily serine protease